MNQMIIGPGVSAFESEKDSGDATENVKARVPPSYRRKVEAIMESTGLSQSEVIRDLIERAVVIKVIRETGVLGVMNNGADQ